MLHSLEGRLTDAPKAGEERSPGTISDSSFDVGGSRFLIQLPARSVSVDLSHTYRQWTLNNLRLNALDDHRHQVLQADALRYLQRATAKHETFDLIMLDPPSFSNSKRMQGILDIQRDHDDLFPSSDWRAFRRTMAEAIERLRNQ